MVVVAIVRSLAVFSQGYLAERGSQSVAYDLRNALFEKLEHLGLSYFDRIETGQLLTRGTSDIEQIRNFTGRGVVQLMAAVLQLVGTVALLLFLNWQLALVGVLMVPLIFAVLVWFGLRVGPLFGRIQQTLGQLNSILQEDLVGLRTVRAFRGEQREQQRYVTVNHDLKNLNIEVVGLFSSNFRTIFLIANLGSLGVLWLGGNQVIDGALQIGELVAFNAYLAFLLQPVMVIGFLSAMVPMAGASAHRVFEVLDAPVDVHDAPTAQPLPPVKGLVEFRDVHFRYPGSETEALKGIAFAAQPGQTIGIIGTTGSGKSTLVHLIPRFYDVTDGAVLIDGHDVRDVTLESLRQQISIVFQTPRLFRGRIRENIAYSRPEASLDEVIAAAQAAQAHDFITALPAGYDTAIGERGVDLSGGQRQRVAIARALLADRPILILDDSTSAVFATTVARIRKALDRLTRERNRTIFVIAQRVSMIRDSDLVLVMDAGRIVAQGTHEQLLATSQLYVDILGSQLAPPDGSESTTAVHVEHDGHEPAATIGPPTTERRA
jgi:ATP-binding cassette subfamily B protein